MFYYKLSYARFISVHVKKNSNAENINCPFSCHEAKKADGTIDLHLTYDTKVITAIGRANVCLLHDTRKTGLRFSWPPHVATGSPSSNKIGQDTWHVTRPVARSVFFTQFLTLRSPTVATTDKNRSTRTITKHVQPINAEAFKFGKNCFSKENRGFKTI